MQRQGGYLGVTDCASGVGVRARVRGKDRVRIRLGVRGLRGLRVRGCGESDSMARPTLTLALITAGMIWPTLALALITGRIIWFVVNGQAAVSALEIRARVRVRGSG